MILALALQEWLIQKSSCPVVYKWVDLGDYFWPRWVKRGQCGAEKKEDKDEEEEKEEKAKFHCSWPRGMKCESGRTRVLHLLRWHCKKRRASGKRQHRCRWYKVPYPVTESCKCA